MPMQNDFRLSPHFKASEFLENHRGGTIEAENIRLGLQEPTLSNMRKLCTDLLEPLRSAFGSRGVSISSGFRYIKKNPETGLYEGLDLAIRKNKKGYLPKSQHTRGEAADIHVMGATERQVFDWFRHQCPVPFGQVIFEVQGRAVWIHISIPGYRIPERGGTRIYGKVTDAKWTSKGWRYVDLEYVNRW